MRRLQVWLATKVFEWLDQHQPDEMHRRIKSHVDRIVPDVARKTVMAYLDQQHLLHCAACPTRFGLHRVMTDRGEVYLCDKDYSQYQKRQMAEAHQQ